MLSFPTWLVTRPTPIPKEIPQTVLADLSEIHLQYQLGAIASSYGPPAAFIHLHPSSLHPSQAGDRNEIQFSEIQFSEAETAILKQVFLMAKHLKTSLNKAAQLGQSCFMTIAHLDGAFGLGESTHFSPIGAGLFGLTKTLSAEWKSVFCRAVDCNPEMSNEQVIQSVLAEINDPNRCLVEVGRRFQQRTTLTLCSP
ncbi:MAG: hypothetical protein ACFE0I_10720 [Elainellaceae cyanobacterium]